MDELEYLLALDGEIFVLESGFWVKFEAKRVVKTEAVPHGISYSLTLHDKSNRRVLGYDNAHSFKPKRAKFGAKKSTYDHIHKKDEVFAYEFDSAGGLIEDFWHSVNDYIDRS